MREPTARPVQADAGSPARAAEHGGDLSGVEILPGDECEQLALIGTQTPERDSGEVRLVVDQRRGRHLVSDGCRGARQTLTPLLSPPVVGQDPARGRVEPKRRQIAFGHVTEAAPGDKERLGDDIGGVVPRGPSQGIVTKASEHLLGWIHRRLCLLPTQS